MKPIYLFFGIIIIALGFIFLTSDDGDSELVIDYDSFNQCLTEAGAKFYGAFWCPHCQDQKKTLGSNDNTPYVECSTPDSQGQLQICTDAEITGYPTWKFSDGSTLNGAQSLTVLSNKTNCPLN